MPIIRHFVAPQQLRLFQHLKQSQFSGQLVLTDAHSRDVIFYLYMGRIIYATGGINPVRRWRRNLAAYLPKIAADHSSLEQDLTAIAKSNIKICWDYELLCLWFKQGKTSREQMTKMIEAVLIEILFDLTQGEEISYKMESDTALPNKLVLIDAEQVIKDTYKLWKRWENAKLNEFYPNDVPIIKTPELLKGHIGAQTYQVVSKVMDGKRCWRDTAVQLHQHILKITKALIPYVNLGFIRLEKIADLKAPIVPPPPVETPENKALIACVDDSPMICQSMEKIITGAGYQFMSSSDPHRALGLIIARKPDLVFLDLVMPNANGYEICSRLRQISLFRETPIIILTANDGVVERMRTKMVGCTEFLSKPIEAKTVLEAIARYLNNKHLQK